MKISSSSIRSTVGTARQARHLWRLHARAERLLMRSLTGPDDAARSRRLFAYVLRRLGAATPPALDTAALGHEAARAIRQLEKPLWLGAARSALVALALAGLLAIAVAVLALVSKPVRARFFPTDVARTARYEVSSTVAGLPPAGIGSYARGEVFFHTNLEMRPHLDLDFGRPIRVREVRIENRRDCCGERALPLDVKAIRPDGEHFLCQRRAPFSAWTCQGRGIRTSRLRIEVPGVSMLHLRSVEVYE